MQPVLVPATLHPAEDFGGVLASRSLAAQLREQVEQRARHEPVAISFAGVETVSPSFADELFAKIDQTLVSSGRVTFVDVDEDIEAIIRTVSGRR
jgi:hypothetical protein